MALTSNDETDLLLPLYRGIHETPRFMTFLDRLKRRSSAEYVSLALRRNGDPASEAEVYFSGQNLHRMAQSLGDEVMSAVDAELQSQLRPYRVYSVSDFADHDPKYRKMRAQLIEPLGIVDQRIIRIPIEPGLSGWLVLARGKACSAADSALLSNLAPYLEGVLRTLHGMERNRIEAQLCADGLTRSATGWILFDAEARIVAIEPATRDRMADSVGTAPRTGERLQSAPGQSEKKLVEAAQRFANGADPEPGDAVLCEEPRIDALLVPAARSGARAMRFPSAVMTAYCRFEKPGSTGRSNQLAGVFDLPNREAELAIALADGNSIAEAAKTMGLTLETARNYSKRLYAKLGVRGQAELVRLVHRSSAVLA
ncbi:MAG: LuxR C-terminal-related transcriptional regulator [Sphingomonadaceae bacterium]|nr:LuxR C-terminal-related transcriptional regulator [Sphingomonadaceae bacterium]